MFKFAFYKGVYLCQSKRRDDEKQLSDIDFIDWILRKYSQKFFYESVLIGDVKERLTILNVSDRRYKELKMDQAISFEFKNDKVSPVFPPPPDPKLLEAAKQRKERHEMLHKTYSTKKDIAKRLEIMLELWEMDKGFR